MSYNQRQHEGVSIIELSGEIDLSQSPMARQQILGVIESGQDLLVDMAAVSYIDSSGVASLVEGYQAARKSQRRFALVAVSNSAMSVLSLARLDQVFPIYASVDAYFQQDD